MRRDVQVTTIDLSKRGARGMDLGSSCKHSWYMGSEWMQGVGRRKTLDDSQVAGFGDWTGAWSTDGSKEYRRKSRLFGEGKVMHRFCPDVWELVSSVLPVLSGRG